MNLQDEARELLHAPEKFIRKGYGLAAETVKRRHLVPKSILVGVVVRGDGAMIVYSLLPLAFRR